MRADSSIVPSPLQIDIANRIVALIKHGVALPGQHLTEESLATQFGVSRSPVRAALRLLEDRGYVELKTNAGVFVTKRAPKMRFDLIAGDTLTEDNLYKSIISDRANNTLPESVSEAELMARYSAPKGVLMRTLLRMTSEGLVERRKGHGWSFLPILDSKEAKDDSYRFRMLVECGSLREPTFKIDAAELERSRVAHERFLQRRGNGQSPTDFFEMNANFHEMLSKFSGNRFIHQVIRQQNQLRRFEEYSTYVNRSIHLTESCQEHLAITHALESGDNEWAAALLYRHLSLASRV